jgi:predicted GIY-YIG superfamily endonuclease
VTHTVYRLFDAEGALLYVGSTINLPKRLGEHRRKQPWGHLIASWTADGPHEQSWAYRLEGLAIEDEKPLHNQRRAPEGTVTFDDMTRAMASLTMPTLESIEAAEAAS